jgi:hypothetical protein
MVEFINCLEISERVQVLKNAMDFFKKGGCHKKSTQIKQDCFLKFHNFRSKM